MLNQIRLTIGLVLVKIGRSIIPIGFGIRYQIRLDVLALRLKHPLDYATLDYKLRLQDVRDSKVGDTNKIDEVG